MGSESRHIALYLPNLNGGGAQRVMVTLANEFVKRGIRTDLVVVRHTGPFSKHVSDNVNVFDLNANRALTSLPGLAQYLQQRRPSGLLSTLAGTNVIAALAHYASNSESILVLRETSSVSAALGDYHTIKGGIINQLASWAYNYSNYVVGISEGLSENISANLIVPVEKVKTIYNPVVSSQNISLINDESFEVKKNCPFVLGVGRLVEEKDFSTLIKAFALAKSRDLLRLVILGEGEKKDSLIKISKDLGIQNDVLFPGFVRNPFVYMKEAEVFVLSSRWEGFGNVLVEAMACGTSVISTDCPSGPSEILENGKWGQLVPVGHEEAMAQAIRATLNGAQDSVDPTRRAEDFHVREIADKYLRLLT